MHAPKFWQNLKPKQRREAVISVVLIIVVIGGTFGGMEIAKAALRTDYPLVVVISGSMEPTIMIGDLLVVYNKAPEDIMAGSYANNSGDIIIYDSHNLWPTPIPEPIVHRVVNKTYNPVLDRYYFITKGDNANTNPNNDPYPVPQGNVLGVVKFIIPKIGKVKIFLDDSGLTPFLIGGLAIALVVSIIYDIKHPEEDNKKKKKGKHETTPPDTSPSTAASPSKNIDLGV